MSSKPKSSLDSDNATPTGEPPVGGGTSTTKVSLKESESSWAWALHVYGVIALAFAAPMYGRLENRAQYLVQMTTGAIVALVVIWSVLVPLLVLLFIAGIRRWNSRAGEIVLHFLIGVCAFLIVMDAVSHRFWRGGWGLMTLIGCAGLGYAASQVYRRWTWPRTLLAVAAFGSILFPATLLWIFIKATYHPQLVAELSVKRDVPVVMVVFDCFTGVSLMDGKREIDPDRFPNFAELARTSNWYRNCTSVHPRTSHALPAILSGRFPADVRLPTVEQYPQNLFTLLESTRAYDLTAFEPFTLLCARDKLRDRATPDPWTQWQSLFQTIGIVYLNDLLPPDLPIDLPQIPRSWFGLSHDLLVDRAQRHGLMRYSWDIDRDDQFQHFLDCLDETEKPTLYFGHFALPHFPWDYLPSGRLHHPDRGIRTVWGGEGPLNEDWADDELAVLHAQQQYLLQVGYVDLLIGRLMKRLKETGLLDRCLLVITADHGVSFRKGLSQRLPTDANLADIMSIPLLIKLPGQQEGDTIDLNVESIDVLPTILDVLGIVPPVPMDGRSVIADDFSERPRKVFKNEDRRVKLDGEFPARYELLAQQLDRFGSGEDPLRIFKIGPRPGMLGRRVDGYRLEGPSSVLIRPANFDTIVEYSSEGLVTVHLEGLVEVPDGRRRPVELAIAVNDTIWGVTRTYRAAKLEDLWTVMLPESALKPGKNQIRIFQVSGGGRTVLRECTIGAKARLPDVP